MYLAVNKCNPNEITTMLVEQISQSNCQWFALLDRAFDYEGKSLTFASHDEIIYQSKELDGLFDVSPVLIHLDASTQTQLSAQLKKLVQHCSGRPMLSFIQTELSAKELNQQWQNYLWVETQDNDRFLLRFADCRTLAILGQVTPHSIWPGLTKKISQWKIINREGQIESLPIPAKEILPPEKIKLTNAEYSALLELTQVDAIIDWISENMPELAPKEKKMDFYRQVEQACHLASQENVRSFPDQVSLAIAAILSQTKLLDNQVLKFALRQGVSGNDLNRVIVDLMVTID